MAIVTAMALWVALLPASEARPLALERVEELDPDWTGTPVIAPLEGRDWLDQLRNGGLVPGRFDEGVVRELIRLTSGFDAQYGEGTYVNSATAQLYPQLIRPLHATAMLVPSGAVAEDCGPPEVARPVPVGGIDPRVLRRICSTTMRMADNTVCPGVGPVLGAAERVNSWNCTVSAITANRVITAAHCLRRFTAPAASAYGASDLDIVFGYDDANRGAAIRTVAGGRIVYCRYDAAQDIAVIELAAPVPLGTTMLKRRRAAPTSGMLVHMASHPGGLPLRVSTCLGFDESCVPARVTRVDGSWLRAPIDSLKGSSGAAVVDDAGDLVGIFHGGFAEYAPEPTCTGDITYRDTCDGEWISRADALDAKLFDPHAILPDATCDFVDAPPYGKACN